MNVLDENLRQKPRELLAVWRIPVGQIGIEVGRSGMQDDEIVGLLRRLSRPTFFTRDRDFYKPGLRHAGYCLVRLDVSRALSAEYIRRLLKHPEFNTTSKRLGSVARVGPSGIPAWRTKTQAEERFDWPPSRS